MVTAKEKIEHLCLYGGVDIEDYETYEQFLDSRVTQQDVDYVKDIRMIRLLIENGFRTSGEELNKTEFYRRKDEIANYRRTERLNLKHVISYKLDTSDNSLLANLKMREGLNKIKEIETIVFVICLNNNGLEVSGYIDLAHRLITDDFENIFSGKELLLPKPTDLSYCNLKFLSTRTRDSPNWKVIADSPRGLRFFNKTDQKMVYVDPDRSCGERTSRIRVKNPHYSRLIFFDHHTLK